MTTTPKPVPAGRAPGRSVGHEEAHSVDLAGPHPLGGSPDVPDGRGAVGSPCINVCEMDAQSGYCRGCARTIDEIIAWSQLDDDAKRAVWKQLPARRARGETARAAREGP
jgi:predicted Fe-S protein YdhL (DUF1289 family)